MDNNTLDFADYRRIAEEELGREFTEDEIARVMDRWVDGVTITETVDFFRVSDNAARRKAEEAHDARIMRTADRLGDLLRRL